MADQGTGLMAKKKASPKPLEKWAKKPIVLQLRGSPEWKAWLEKLVEFERSNSASDVTDRALAAYARQVGFAEPPPKRN